MGYRIEYGNGEIRKAPIQKRNRMRKKLAKCLAIVALILTVCSPFGREYIIRHIIPGDDAVTTAALTGLVDALSDGTPIGQAVHTFCVEIVAGGT